MKFIESAIEMEELTQNYYLDLAEKCSANEGLKTILKMLAKYKVLWVRYNKLNNAKLRLSLYGVLGKIFKPMAVNE